MAAKKHRKSRKDRIIEVAERLFAMRGFDGVSLRQITSEYVAELAAGDPLVAKVWASYSAFLRRSRPWQDISELAILTAPSV